MESRLDLVEQQEGWESVMPDMGQEQEPAERISGTAMVDIPPLLKPGCYSGALRRRTCGIRAIIRQHPRRSTGGKSDVLDLLSCFTAPERPHARWESAMVRDHL